MKTCYLAGPMRGLPFFNFPAFDKAAAELRSEDWIVHSPAEKDRDTLDVEKCPRGSEEELKAQGFSLASALTWDFAHILDSSALIALPGWERSTGCLWELTVAHATDKSLWEYCGYRNGPGAHVGVVLFRLHPPAVVVDPVNCGRRYGGRLV